MSSNCTIPSNIQDQLGNYVFGYQFNWGLYGILIVQVYIYHVSSIPDSWPIQAVVYSVFLIETIQIAFATHDSYFQFAVSWGQVSQLNELYYTWLTMPTLIGIISAITQVFYAWRIRILSRGYILSAVVTLLALLQGASAIATGARAYILDEDHGTNISSNLLSSDIVWLSSTAACDVLISACMVFYLSRMRTGIKSTERIINRLIRLVVETGLVTTMVAIVDLGLFIGIPHTPWFGMFSLMLSKLYSNSLLVILNNRSISLRFQADEEMHVHDVDNTQHYGYRRPESFRARAPPGNVIHTDGHTALDAIAIDEATARTMKSNNGENSVLNLVNLQFSSNPGSDENVRRSEVSLNRSQVNQGV